MESEVTPADYFHLQLGLTVIQLIAFGLQYYFARKSGKNLKQLEERINAKAPVRH